jgi:signal peptide peptidase-like protein 2B
MLLYDAMNDDCIFMASDVQQEDKKDVTLLAASITATAAKILLDSINTSSSTAVTLTQPEQSAFDLSELALWLIAVSAVAGGSIWAGKGGLHSSFADDNDNTAEHRSTNNRDSEGLGIEVISVRAAASFIFIASGALLAMFFLLSKWLAFIITGFFSFIAWQACTVTSAAALYSLCPTQWRSYKLTTPSIRVLDFAALSIASLLTATWLILVFVFDSHWAWTLQDVLCFSLTLLVFKTLQLPNLKVSTILLVSAMVYDVWWVFLQPAVVGGPSVMVEVATGGGGGFRMPIVFAIPRFSALGTNPSLAMLGLGDVVLPGLLVAMARRWDVAATKRNDVNDGEEEERKKSGFYFLPMVGAYASGLLITFAALYFGWGGDQGQPALLYLVPCTLGMICTLSCVRGELSALWNWEEEKEEEGVEEGSGRNRRRRGSEDVEQGEGAPLLSHPVTLT